MSIRIYPIEVEAVDETDEPVFKLRTVDAESASLEVRAVLTPANVNDFCDALQRAIKLLELELDTDADHAA